MYSASAVANLGQSSVDRMDAITPPAPPRTKRSPAALREPRPRKREKYTRIACSSCKVRKVKCGGNQPCNRCDELQVECIYNESSQPDIDNTGSQVTHLDLELSVSRINRICEQIQQSMGRFADPHINRTCLQRKRPSENGPTQPRVQSLTDFKYTLSLTRGVLEAKGLPSPPVFTGGHPSLAVDELKSPDALITLLQNARPVVDLGHEKATQLLAVFKNEIYPLYPCISLELAQDSVDSLFSLLSRVPHSATCNVEIIDVEIMKSVMAVALLTRDDMQSPLATDLESQLLWSVGSCLDQEHPQIEDIIMATLLSLYLDLKHRPVKAWRMAGVAAKLCLEVGIHQERFFDNARMNPDRVMTCKRLFACVYDADRKCSFYSGLPWTLHDGDIDMSILRLEPQESYLSTMISLDRNLSETWVIINAPSSQSKDSRERVEFLNFQLQKFVSSMSTGDFPPLAPSVVSPPWLRVSLKRFTRLRVHHIKVLAYVGTFSSIKDLISQPQSAKGLITLAAESVDLYMEMMNDGGISPLILPSAIKILLSALSFMLLAVSQSATEYGPLCTKPFHTAIDILGNSQWSNKDPSIDICGTLEQLRRFAEIIQLSPSKRPGPLISHRQGADNTNTDLGQALGEGNVFDELQTPGSDIFSILGDVNMAQPDMLYINNMFS